MPSTKITGSANIATLDSKIIADLCVGKFFIDATPSVYKGTGADNVKGLKVQIVSPYHIAIKEYDVAYDILDADAGVFEFAIPTQAGGYQLGTYQIKLQITDADDKTYEVVKPITICEPNPKNKLSKTGVIDAVFIALCNEGKLRVTVNNPPAYRGVVSQAQERSFTLRYPTASSLPPIETTVTTFSTHLFDGNYQMFGDVCAEYIGDDNISYKVRYLLDTSKDVRCEIDDCCILNKLSELHQKLNSECSPETREQTTLITLDVLRLYSTAKMASSCGQDASEYILDLEDLLKCSCSVKSSDGTPITGNTPVKDFIIEGCNIDKNVSGLTTTYTFNNYEYIVEIPDNGGALTVSAPQITDCVKKQVITFDVANLYGQVKNLAGTNIIEASYWASIINKIFSGLDATSLGLNAEQWGLLTLSQRLQLIINKVKSCCDCEAVITEHSVTLMQNDVRINFTATDAAMVDIYLDDQKVATVVSPASSILIRDVADGLKHDYKLVPICGSGSSGESVEGSFKEFGCPSIPAPIITQPLIVEADCPFDLNSIYTAPVGYIEDLSLHVYDGPRPESSNEITSGIDSVSSGTYYLVHRNVTGCMSPSTRVIISCATAECSAPINLGVSKVNGGYLVHFQSAVNPPANNSYTVKRRLRADPDIPASYVTLGSTPNQIVWNAQNSRWEILDNSGVDNTLYTYIAQSNCGATAPYIAEDFSYYASCPIISGLTVSMVD